MAISVAFVSYLGHFIDPLAGSSTSDHMLQAGVAAAAIWVLTLVNVRGVRQGGIVQGVTTVLKLMPLSNATQMTEDERALIKRWFEGGAPVN